jgi:hypothetical protein
MSRTVDRRQAILLRLAGMGILLLLLLTLLGGCEAARRVEEAKERGGGGPEPGQPELVVRVVLTEHKIEMPETAAPGETTFMIVNQGDEAHGFNIEGNGVKASFPDTIQSGQAGNVKVNLTPGEYKIWCHVSDHEKWGMSKILRVEPPTGGTVQRR